MSFEPRIESALQWAALAAYTLSAVGFSVSLGGRSRPRFGMGVAAAGVVLLAISLGLRSARVDHLPSLGFFEVAAGLACVMVAAYVAVAYRQPWLEHSGVAVMPIAVVVLAATTVVSPVGAPIGGTLASPWLVAHVALANAAFGCYAVAYALAVFVLLGSGGEPAPEPAQLDALTFRWVGAGFVLQGLMIATGAVWANEAWGRYWGWDPMETWSLLAWAVYALYLHVTLTLGWRGRKAAWIAAAALPVIAFSLLGVPVVYKSIHGAYLAV